MISKSLVSAMLLSTSVSAIAQSEFAANKETLSGAKASLISSVFQSTKTFKTNVFSGTSDELVDAFYRVSFVAAGVKNEDYEFDGNGTLDYEVQIQIVDAKTGKATGLDNTFYAKAKGKKALKIYDCDSTSNCTKDLNVTSAILVDAEAGKGLKIFNQSSQLNLLPEEELFFLKVK
jgi:hypothetical protein